MSEDKEAVCSAIGEFCIVIITIITDKVQFNHWENKLNNGANSN